MTNATKVFVMLFLALQPAPVYRWRHVAVTGTVYVNGVDNGGGTVEAWVGDKAP